MGVGVAVAMVALGALDSRALFERVKPSVAQVQVLSPTGELRGLGSGFVATDDGRVVTNHHVIDGASQLKVVFGDGQSFAVEQIMLDDPEHDVAVIRVNRRTTPLPMKQASLSMVGDEVMLVGSPYGLDFTVSVGAVAKYRPDGLPKEMIALAGDEDDPVARQPVLQLTAPAGQGNSGGPVFNPAGEVLGIVQSGIGGHGNFTFAVPSETLLAAVEKASRVEVSDGASTQRLLNLAISLVVFAAFAALYFFKVRR